MVQGAGAVSAVGKELGVLADESLAFGPAAGGDGFEDADTFVSLREDSSDPTGDDGFADFGVGAGYKESPGFDEVGWLLFSHFDFPPGRRIA